MVNKVNFVQQTGIIILRSGRHTRDLKWKAEIIHKIIP